MTIYRTYDQAELDAQYNNGARVAEAPQFRERWAADSATVRDSVAATLNVSYGDHPRQVMDVFAGAGSGAPTLVFIHGGYWHMSDNSFYHYPAPALHDAGINYVTIDYPLAPEVRVGDIVASVRQGLAHLWRRGSEYGIDPNRLTVSGHSAGGHLTAMVMATDWSSVGDGLPGDLAKAGIAISGLYELEPIRLCYLNDILALTSEDVSTLSPVENLAPRTLHVTVGGNESEEYLRQMADFHAAWTAAGGTGSQLICDGDNHFSVIDGLAQSDHPLFALIEEACQA